MNKFFYVKLALSNMNKNRKTVIPYLLTCIGTIAMYYIMHLLYKNDGLSKMSGGDSLRTILGLGAFIIGFFAVIFLFYTSAFLIKNRKKEFGLFNILGMEKKHLARVMIWESIFSAIVSLTLGLVSGIVLSKVMFLLLTNILKFNVGLTYMVSMPSLRMTLVLFVIIFAAILLNNLRHIYFSKPIELLKGGQVGEKEPKTKWLLVLIGVASLSTGYYLAITTESPLAALNQFFIAVILVIIGTYALFTAGTIFLLKMLRKNKTFYYKTKNFISVSSMIYRMKQNAVGLANICILSTAVLVMVSSTVSLYIGMEDLLKTRYPKAISISADVVSEEDSQFIDNLIEVEAEKHKLNITSSVSYRSLSFPVIKEGNQFQTGSPNIGSLNSLGIIVMIPVSDYNKIENQSIELKENEALLYTFRGEPIKDQTVGINGKTLTIKDQIDQFNFEGIYSAMAMDSYFFIVKDEEVALNLYPAEEINDKNPKLSGYYGIDVEGTAENQVALTNSLTKALKDAKIDGYAEGREESRESFYSVYGGLFFLGIFLGALFLMATVLIMYYKQISEGYDDKERYEIMQKVGLSKEEIKQSIKSQVLIVFFLPLVTAVIHIAFAFKVITKLLNILNLTNIGLFTLCTAGSILIFAAFYALIYALTAREYYKIVS